MSIPTTVYLTKYPVHQALAVDHPGKPQRGWDLDSPVFRHRATMHLFPQINEATPRADANILFRLDTAPGSAPFFLIQSLHEPTGVETAQTKMVELTTPDAGSTIAFRLAVNAIKRKADGGITPIAFDLDEHKDGVPGMTDWLNQKLSPALTGIELLNHHRQVLGTDRRGAKRGSDFAVQVDTVDGFAQVADPAHLQELLLKGVGRAKSYGCGLLSIRVLES